MKRRRRQTHANSSPTKKLRIELLETRICLAANVPLFLFTAEAKIIEGESSLVSGRSEDRIVGVRSVGPTPEISDLHFTTTVQSELANVNEILPGSASGTLSYSATATQLEDQFTLNLNASIDYQGSGSGVPYFGNSESISVEVLVFVRSTFQEKEKFTGVFDYSIRDEDSKAEQCFTSGFLTGCDSSLSRSYGISAFDHGGLGGTPITKEAGTYRELVGPEGVILSGPGKIEHEGVEYLLIGGSRVEPRFSWGYTYIIGAQSGDYAADVGIDIAAKVEGTLDDSPPQLKSVHAIAGFDGTDPFDPLTGEPNESDGIHLIEQPTTLKPLTLVAIATNPTGYKSSVQFSTGFEASELGLATRPVGSQVDSNANFCRGKVMSLGLASPTDLVICQTVYPSQEEYGANNVVRALLTSERDGLAGPITFDNMISDPFEISFAKLEDDDNDGEPNWFDYWKSDLATSHGIPPRVYFRDMEGAYGLHEGGADKCREGVGTPDCILLSNLAAGKSNGDAFFMPPSLAHLSNGFDPKGIDFLETQLTHELFHRYHRFYDHEDYPGFIFDLNNDNDGDGLTDALEEAMNEALGIADNPDGKKFDVLVYRAKNWSW